MNEVSLLFFGQPEKLNSVLLLNLNIVEFRDETPEYNGLYILENKFGKEILRKLSLTFEEDTGDWLIYRYLSAEESARLKNPMGLRRIYVLLQNYMTLDYFKLQVPSDDPSCFYIVGQTEVLKSVASVTGQLPAKNLVVVRNVKKKSVQAAEKESVQIPDFLAAFLKLMLNPADEFGVVSRNVMQSNQRILYRFVELLRFLHFVIYMTVTVIFKGFGVQLFWKSFATAGFLRVFAIRSKFFTRHVFLMSFYKTWGVAVDGSNFLIRGKNRFLLTVYYRAIHRFYFQFIHSAVHGFWLYFLSPFYYKLFRPLFYSVYLWLERWLYYKGLHPLFFKIRRVAGHVWEKVLSPFYFATFHRFFHGVLRPILNAVYYRGIHRFFFKVVHPFYHRALMPVLTFIFYRTFHRLYHRALRPLGSFVFYHSVHRLYHRGLVPLFSYSWYEIFLSRFYYQGVYKFYYKGLYKVYYEGLYKLYYNGLYRLYYNGPHKLYLYLIYNVWPWVKFHIFIKTHHFFIYKVRHVILMAAFKSYGLIYDLVMLVARVTKLYLLYPVFKVYWFASFQYDKRVKKYFA